VEINEIGLRRENRTLRRSLKNLMLIFFKDRLVFCIKKQKIQHPLSCSAEPTKGTGHPIYLKKSRNSMSFGFCIYYS